MLNILPNYAEKIRVGFGRCVKEFFFFFFFFEEACRKKRYCHYELNVALVLEVYLFYYSMFDFGTSKLRSNMRTEKKKKHSL